MNDPPGGHGELPEGGRGHGVAFHGEKHGVHGRGSGAGPARARSKSRRRSLPETVRAAGRGAALGGEAVRDQEDVVGWRIRSARGGRERILEAGAALGRGGERRLTRARSSNGPGARASSHVPSVPGRTARAWTSNGVELEPRFARELGAKPVRRAQGPPPACRRGSGRARAGAAGARRSRWYRRACWPTRPPAAGVAAPDLEAGEVLAVAVADERAHLVARDLAAGEAAGQALGPLPPASADRPAACCCAPAARSSAPRRWRAPPATASPPR